AASWHSPDRCQSPHTKYHGDIDSFKVGIETPSTCRAPPSPGVCASSGARAPRRSNTVAKERLWFADRRRSSAAIPARGERRRRAALRAREHIGAARVAEIYRAVEGVVLEDQLHRRAAAACQFDRRL